MWSWFASVLQCTVTLHLASYLHLNTKQTEINSHSICCTALEQRRRAVVTRVGRLPRGQFALLQCSSCQEQRLSLHHQLLGRLASRTKRYLTWVPHFKPLVQKNKITFTWHSLIVSTVKAGICSIRAVVRPLRISNVRVLSSGDFSCIIYFATHYYCSYVSLRIFFQLLQSVELL